MYMILYIFAYKEMYRYLDYIYMLRDIPKFVHLPFNVFKDCHPLAVFLPWESSRSGAKEAVVLCQFSSVQSLSRVRLFATQKRPPYPSPTAGVYKTHVHWVGDAIQPSYPLSSPSPPALNLLMPSSIRVFSNESALRIRWPKYWSFSFSIRTSNEHPGLISFRMDWLDLLAVQGTLKSLLQHHSSKASILRCSAFITVQLSHRYTTTGKTIALTRRTFVGQVILMIHGASRC